MPQWRKFMSFLSFLISPLAVPIVREIRALREQISLLDNRTMASFAELKDVIAAEAAQVAEKLAAIQAALDAALADNQSQIDAAIAAVLAEQSAQLAEVIGQVKAIVPDEPEEPPVDDGEVVTELQ